MSLCPLEPQVGLNERRHLSEGVNASVKIIAEIPGVRMLETHHVHAQEISLRIGRSHECRPNQHGQATRAAPEYTILDEAKREVTIYPIF